MREEQAILLAREISRIERELYLKKSQLAATEARGRDLDLGVVGTTLGHEEFKEAFSKIVKEVATTSVGGNSVEDLARERQR